MCSKPTLNPNTDASAQTLIGELVRLSRSIVGFALNTMPSARVQRALDDNDRRYGGATSECGYGLVNFATDFRLFREKINKVCKIAERHSRRLRASDLRTPEDRFLMNVAVTSEVDKYCCQASALKEMVDMILVPPINQSQNTQDTSEENKEDKNTESNNEAQSPEVETEHEVPSGTGLYPTSIVDEKETQDDEDSVGEATSSEAAVTDEIPDNPSESDIDESSGLDEPVNQSAMNQDTASTASSDSTNETDQSNIPESHGNEYVSEPGQPEDSHKVEGNESAESVSPNSQVKDASAKKDERDKKHKVPEDYVRDSQCIAESAMIIAKLFQDLLQHIKCDAALRNYVFLVVTAEKILKELKRIVEHLESIWKDPITLRSKNQPKRKHIKY
ncbi:hypothetical protein ACOME3_003529 [Neoechinorhynchus agilis]